MGFFEDLKKGFEAGSASVPKDAGRREQPGEDAAPSFLDGLLKGFMPKTEEEILAERIKRGEGVVWSADASRAWRAINGMPRDEISLEESKQLAAELSIPLPAALAEATEGGS